MLQDMHDEDPDKVESYKKTAILQKSMQDIKDRAQTMKDQRNSP